MSDQAPPQPPDDGGDGTGTTFGSIQPIEIQEEMEQSFLDYAMSVITTRALPDARDGLKPVHRRILWTMFDSGVRPDRDPVKCARVVGDVMGKYHPHGDQAIYDALVRLGQHFSVRHLLIDPQGNFGSPSDPPAAMRYCVTGETLVATPDGTHRIVELAEAEPNSEVDIDRKVYDRRGHPVRATKFFHSGSHPTLRLRTREGFELTGTQNHPVLCIEPVAGVPMLQWKLLEEIRPGGRVVIRRDAVADELLATADVPYVAEYVAGETGLRVDTLVGPDIIDHIGSAEVRAVVEPLVAEGYYYAEVASVSEAGVQPVYSIRVDSDDHSFVTNGFVSHNTECRLTNAAMQLLDGITEDTVDFADNYDGRDREPTVLPSRFPNLLVNGSQGIAVGMATNIPPHNLGEVIDATVHLIDNPGATPDDLMQFVKGPDFPTGAQILGRQGIIDAIRTGRGSIKLRAVAEIVEGKRGEQIVVTEIPYQTSVEQIAEKAAELVDKRELDGIRDIRNESAKGKTRLVFELKRDATALVVLNNLYKHTPMQTNFAVNMVALVDGVPRTLNLADALRAYVDHQKEVVTRRSQYRLDKAQKRAHIVEGLLRALDQIDAIIALIRASQDRAAARDGLMAEPFEFSEVQANHILDMTLGRLTRLGREELEAEMAQLREEIADLEAILASEEKLKTVIKDELAVIKGEFAEERRSVITLDPGEFDLEDLIEDEELVVTLSAKGYVKTMPADTFRTQGRGGRGVQGVKLRDEDYLTQLMLTTAHAYLLFFSNRGKVYRLKAHEIPMKDRTARGTAIVNLLQLGPDERIQAIIDTRDYETHRFLFFATKKGQVKKTKFTEYDSSLRAGIIAINLRDDDELVRVIPTNGGQDIFMVSRKGMTIRFSEDEVRPMGRSAAGVRGMKLKAGDEVESCDVVREDADLLIVTDAGYGKRTKVERFSSQGRGGQGVKGIKLTAARGQVVAAFMVGLDDEIFVVNSAGVAIRMPVREISSQGRDATGVRVMSLEDGQTVSAVAPVLQQDED